MKIVIDIAEEDFERGTATATAIRNGIPLDEVLDDVRADVINIADGRPSLKVRHILQIIDKFKVSIRGNRS